MLSQTLPQRHVNEDTGDATQPHVLVVDDHADIREPLEAYLARSGLAVSTAASAREMRARVAARSFDLIVLDIMLPDEDGLSLCRYVTSTMNTPVIFLTAKSATPDRVAGLETGADDYMIKPFEPSELVARIRTVLRRRARDQGAGPQPAAIRFGFDGWVFDATRRELFAPTGEQLPISEAEFQMLSVLVSHPNLVLSRERLLDLTQRNESQVFDRSVDTQISRLRRKMEPDPRRPAMIKTAWGNGYIFVANVQRLAT